jgi:hypothetical protein
MSLWLTKEELIELTGYKLSKRQKLALADMAIPFRSRSADGFPLVERAQFEGSAGSAQRTVGSPKIRREPNLAFLKG